VFPLLAEYKTIFQIIFSKTNNSTKMKKHYTLFFSLIFICALSTNAQIPNSGFELWTTNSAGRLDLQNWETGNVLFDKASTVQEVGRTGTGYSAKLISVYDSSVSYYEGGRALLFTVPFSGPVKPNAVLGYWKTLNPGFDAAVFAEVFLYDAGFTEIGYGGIQTPFGLTLSAWTNFSIPISYTTNDPVAYYDLTFTWYNFGDDSTAHAFIDDVSFDVSTNVHAIGQDNKFIVATLSNGIYKLISTTLFSDKSAVKIYDLSGKLVTTMDASTQANQTNEFLVDISSLEAGIYYCNIADDEKMSTVKLLKL